MFYNLIGKHRFSLRLPNPTRGRVTSAATAAARAYCEIPGDNRVKIWKETLTVLCAPVVAYRGRSSLDRRGGEGGKPGPVSPLSTTIYVRFRCF